MSLTNVLSIRARGKSKERQSGTLGQQGNGSASNTSIGQSSVRAARAGSASNKSAATEQKRLVVAIDYGTTYSKAAYGFETSSEANQSLHTPTTGPIAVRNWDYGRDKYAVSSNIAYKNEDGLQCKWGFQIPSVDHLRYPTCEPDNQGWGTVQWAKITLEIPELTYPDRRAMSPGDVTSPNEKALRNMKDVVPEKTPMNVVSDYLKRLWDHVRKQVEGAIFAGVEYEKTLILTVPAKWSEEAAIQIHQAARCAGLWGSDYRFLVIKEPEAAAVWIMRHFGSTHSLKAGDHFIVCDAGGGTLDLALYEMVCNSSESLVLASRTSSTGCFYGSVYLDQKFKERLKLGLGAELYNRLGPEGMERVMLKWELVKSQFTGDDNENLLVQLPFDPQISEYCNNNGVVVRNNNFILSKSDMEIIFDSVVTQLTCLFCEQKQALKDLGDDKEIKAICLTGGLGNSAYLKKRLSNMHQTKSFQVITLPSEKSQMGVCYGAVITGLDKTIEVTHIAPYSFGYRKIDDSVFWFIKAGTSIKPREIFRIKPRFVMNVDRDKGGADLGLPLCTGRKTEIKGEFLQQDLGWLKLRVSPEQFESIRSQQDEGNISIHLYVEICFTLGCVTFKYDIKEDLSNAKERVIDYCSRKVNDDASGEHAGDR